MKRFVHLVLIGGQDFETLRPEVTPFTFHGFTSGNDDHGASHQMSCFTNILDKIISDAPAHIRTSVKASGTEAYFKETEDDLRGGFSTREKTLFETQGLRTFGNELDFFYNTVNPNEGQEGNRNRKTFSTCGISGLAQPDDPDKILTNVIDEQRTIYFDDGPFWELVENIRLFEVDPKATTYRKSVIIGRDDKREVIWVEEIVTVLLYKSTNPAYREHILKEVDERKRCDPELRTRLWSETLKCWEFNMWTGGDTGLHESALSEQDWSRWTVFTQVERNYRGRTNVAIDFVRENLAGSVFDKTLQEFVEETGSRPETVLEGLASGPDQLESDAQKTRPCTDTLSVLRTCWAVLNAGLSGMDNFKMKGMMCQVFNGQDILPTQNCTWLLKPYQHVEGKNLTPQLKRKYPFCNSSVVKESNKLLRRIGTYSIEHEDVCPSTHNGEDCPACMGN